MNIHLIYAYICVLSTFNVVRCINENKVKFEVVESTEDEDQRQLNTQKGGKLKVSKKLKSINSAKEGKDIKVKSGKMTKTTTKKPKKSKKIGQPNLNLPNSASTLPPALIPERGELLRQLNMIRVCVSAHDIPVESAEVTCIDKDADGNSGTLLGKEMTEVDGCVDIPYEKAAGKIYVNIQCKAEKLGISSKLDPALKNHVGAALFYLALEIPTIQICEQSKGTIISCYDEGKISNDLIGKAKTTDSGCALIQYLWTNDALPNIYCVVNDEITDTKVNHNPREILYFPLKDMDRREINIQLLFDGGTDVDFSGFDVSCWDYDSNSDDDPVGSMVTTTESGKVTIEYNSRPILDDWPNQLPDIYCVADRVFSGEHSRYREQSRRFDNYGRRSLDIEIEVLIPCGKVVNRNSAPTIIDVSKPLEYSLKDKYVQDAMERFRTRSAPDVYGWVVLEEGKIVSEWYNNVDLDGDPINEDTLFHLFSGTKTLTGVMFAMMEVLDKIKLSQQLKDVITDSRFDSFWKNNDVDSEEKGRITIGSLLQMSSGHHYGLDPIDLITGARLGGLGGEGVNTIEEFKKHDTGSGNYKYIMAHNILSYVMKGQTGYDPAEFAEKEFFPALGIDQFAWWFARDSCWFALNCWWNIPRISGALHGAMIRIKDYAKIGQFVLQNGRISNKDINPGFPSWFYDDQTIPSLGFSNSDYHKGFFFKNPETGSNHVNGMGGKLLTWQNTTTGGRVYAIINLVQLFDDASIVDGQGCHSNHCERYPKDGFSANFLRLNFTQVINKDSTDSYLDQQSSDILPADRGFSELMQKFMEEFLC